MSNFADTDSVGAEKCTCTGKQEKKRNKQLESRIFGR